MADVLLGDVLRLILELIDSPVCLVRAAATCKRWCRIISSPGFLRRFRSDHAPTLVAGDYFNHSTLLSALASVVQPRTRHRTSSSSLSVDASKTRDRPTFVPAPSSSTIDATKFSLDFLPNDEDDEPHAWTVFDSRGSLLLLIRSRLGHFDSGFPDMFVCEPATRCYKKIPPPPMLPRRGDCYKAAYLVDGETNAAGGRIGMSNFKVLCVFCRLCSRRAATFTVADGSSWSDKAPRIVLGQVDPHTIELALDNDLVRFEEDPLCPMRTLGRAGGSWYFHNTLYESYSEQLIVLDGGTGEFSMCALSFPSDSWVDFHYENTNFYVADGRDGKLRVVAVFDETLKVFARLDDGKWAPEKSVVLSEATHSLPGYDSLFFEEPLNILTRAPGFVILSPQAIETWLISVDLETMEVALAEEDMGPMVYRCELPWPPALNAGIR